MTLDSTWPNCESMGIHFQLDQNTSAQSGLFPCLTKTKILMNIKLQEVYLTHSKAPLISQITMEGKASRDHSASICGKRHYSIANFFFQFYLNLNIEPGHQSSKTLRYQVKPEGPYDKGSVN